MLDAALGRLDADGARARRRGARAGPERHGRRARGARALRRAGRGARASRPSCTGTTSAALRAAPRPPGRGGAARRAVRPAPSRCPGRAADGAAAGDRRARRRRRRPAASRGRTAARGRARSTDGFVHGRGSVDMKGAVVAALHALAALRRPARRTATVVLRRGRLARRTAASGTFAALRARQRVRRLPDPRADGLRRRLRPGRRADVRRAPCAGVAAHAAHRLEGVSAIDRYLPVHAALAAHERELNAAVEHPLMRALELPYPLLVGRIAGGGVVEQRARPARVRGPRGRARRRGAGARRARRSRPSWPRPATAPSTALGPAGSSPPARRRRTTRSPALVRAAVGAETGREARVAGVPWGADMRLFCARGIPCVMAGPPGIELAHAVDERVAVADLVTVARAIVRVVFGFA